MKKKFLVVCVCLLGLIFVFTGCSFGSAGNTDTQTYTLQYNYDGVQTITVTSGETYFIENIPTKEHHVFLGLFDAKDGGTQYVDEDGMCVSPFTDGKNMILYVRFAPEQYIVRLEYGDADAEGFETSRKVSYGESIGALPCDMMPTEGKDFVGWFSAPDCGGTKIADAGGTVTAEGTITEKLTSASVNNIITIYAGYSVQKHTVTFCDGDGKELATASILHGGDFAAEASKLRINGKLIVGWSKVRYGNEFTGPITYDIRLYALGYLCHITYDAAGGSECAAEEVRSGETVTLPVPIRKGYSFDGWRDASGDKVGSALIVDDDISLTASWTILRYTLQFDAAGGSECDTVNAVYGDKVTLPVPVRAKYTFAGWRDAAGNTYSGTITVDADLSLTAIWNITVFTLSFDAAGGTSCASKTVAEGETASLPATSRSGYRFLYWKDTAGNKAAAEVTVTRSMKYTAVWEANTYTVTLDANGGSVGETSHNVTYDRSFSLPVPVLKGHIFQGWCTASGAALTSATGEGINNWQIAYDTKLTARWQQPENYYVALERVSCKTDNGYDPNEPQTDDAVKNHTGFEFGDLLVSGCYRNADNTYSIAAGGSLELKYRLLVDPADCLPVGFLMKNTKGQNLSDDSCKGVYGTNINGKVGKGAYYIKTTYTDGSNGESSKVNFMANATKGSELTLSLPAASGKKIASLYICVVYELDNYGYTVWWWNSYSNWRCTATLNFS